MNIASFTRADTFFIMPAMSIRQLTINPLNITAVTVLALYLLAPLAA
jgi:hypothetical protein